MRHVEEFALDAVAYLRANLPTRIAALNAEKDDGLVLAVPADDGGALGRPEVAYSLGSESRVSMPWVEVAVPDFDLGEFSLAQYDADFSLSVVVAAMVEEVVSPHRLTVAMMRWSRVLVETLMQPGAFGDGETVESVRGAVRAANPETGETVAVRGGVVLVFTLSSVAVRP